MKDERLPELVKALLHLRPGKTKIECRGAAKKALASTWIDDISKNDVMAKAHFRIRTALSILDRRAA